MALNKTTNISQWNPQGSCIERLMDNAAYTSAHPDDTLVLVGPARYSNVVANSGDGSKLTAVGSLDGFGASNMIDGSTSVYAMYISSPSGYNKGFQYDINGDTNFGADFKLKKIILSVFQLDNEE